MMITITQATTDLHYHQIRKLKREYLAWVKQTYYDDLDALEKIMDPIKFEQDLASLPGKFAPLSGRLLIAHVEDVPAGTVALRSIGDQICEMNSMFVSSHFMGKGIGRALANALIEEARTMEYQKMRLTTGPRQIAAQRLYRSLGFQEIEPYFDLPQDLAEKGLFMELDL